MKKYLLLILVLFFIPYFTYSQSNDPGLIEQLSVDFSPEFPRPNQAVFVSIESYQTDLSKTGVSWYINGEMLESGPGLKNFSFINGDLGEETILLIRITKQNGSVLDKRYSLYPGEIDLYYEAETYAPPFFKGRPEYSTQSGVKFVVIPNLVDSNKRKISSDQINYTWRINGEVDAQGSGVGKDVYYYSSDIIPKPVQVYVEAQTISTNQTAGTALVIDPVEPKVLVYEKNPIYGTVFEQVIKNDFVLTRDEVEVEAVPYNFSSNILNSGVFDWSLDDKEIAGFKSSNIIFRKIGGDISSNRISVNVRHENNFLQSAKNIFNLNFGNSNQNFNF